MYHGDYYPGNISELERDVLRERGADCPWMQYLLRHGFLQWMTFGYRKIFETF